MATQSESQASLAAQSEHYFAKGVEHHAAGNLEAAISAYRASLHGNPDGPDILSNLGIALCEIGRLDEGIAQMRHALRVQPDDPDVLNNLGNALYTEGHYADAIETLTHAATISPQDADVRLLLARACLANQQVDQAVENLKAAVLIDPDHEEIDSVRSEIAQLRPEFAPKQSTNGANGHLATNGHTPSNGQTAANGNGHAAPDIDEAHEVEPPHYDSRNGGYLNTTPAVAEADQDAQPVDGEYGSYSGVVADGLVGGATVQADPGDAATPPTYSHAAFTGFGFHHPETIKRLYGNNKVFAWCIFGVILLHLAALVYLYFTGQLNRVLPPEMRIRIVSPPVKDVVKPLKAPPLGAQTPNPSHNAHPPHPHPHQAPTRSVVISTTGPGDVPDPDKAAPLSDFNPDDKLSAKDFDTQPAGDETPGNGVPAGFADGKIGGKVYFIRLKHGSGAWDAYADGTGRLLSFANKYFPCEAETRPMSAAEIRDNYLDKGAIPSFLYIYVDDTFNLTNQDVTVLRNFIARGGFLFLDGRPDPDVKSAVDAQMARVAPGSPLSPISGRDPINSFLFRLSAPGIGENFLGVNGVKGNYAIRQNGRIVVFFTLGNFSHFYEGAQPNDAEYALAQYQMGCNVIAYAIEKGDTSKMTTMAGANAKVTTQALQALGFLEGGGSPKATKPGESVKVLPKGVKPDQDPGEVKGLVDDN